jgi:ribonuclease P protein component, eubacterial
MPATLKKVERLCSLKEIQELLKKGNTIYNYPFKVVFISYNANPQKEDSYNSIVVSVPKRNFKRAVKRNLLKRRIRESYRLNKNILSGDKKINVMFVYISKEVLPYNIIEVKIKEILQKITDIVNERKKEI